MVFFTDGQDGDQGAQQKRQKSMGLLKVFDYTYTPAKKI